MTMPTKLNTAQKEEALPFLTQAPPKSKSSKSKVQKDDHCDLYFHYT
jgi:hypothetical protein